ncbi:unnamed protein product [Closterium sp. NIES-65]|nr:unnamed protein product [Closterium sp. NIES-65]
MAYLFPSQVVSIRPLRAVRPDDGRELPLRNLKIPLKHLNLPPSKAAPRVRTRDHSLTIKCDAGKPVRPADLSTAEIAFVEIEPSLPIDTGIETRKLGEEEGESNGGKGESNVRPVRGEEPGDRGSGDRGSGDKRSGRRAEKTSRGGESCEEEEAVAIIARVLRGKFGPQIVREEDGGGSREGGKEIKEGGEEKEVEEAERVKEEEGVPVCEMEDGEGREDDIKAEFSEEELPGSTSFFTPAMPLKGARATSPSSLLSLYRFFSSHLGISSPSTVASLLASHPALLRSDPASDLLPRVRLLQSYGISQATIVHVTITNASWLRSSLPQIQGTIEFILARGVRRSKLGMVIRGSPYLIRSHARSTNLDILVEAAGIPEEKLGVIIERCPNILCRSEESIQDQIKLLSDYLSDGFEEKGTEEDTSSSTGHLKQHLKKHKNRQRLDKKILLTRLLLNYPRILLSSSDRISANLSLLQSFTPPDSPSIAIPVLRHAPSILNLGSENLLAKLQFFVELVGKKAAGRVVSSHPLVLTLSKENLEGKVAVLSGLIGPENAALAVARFPLLLTSGEETMKQNYAELLREFQEALEGGGGDEGGIEGLEAGGIGEAKEGDGEYRSQNGKQEGISGVGEGSVNGVEELARKLVINLAVKSPQCVYYSWDGNMRHKVEYLKREMGLSIMEVLAFPPFLGFNLDRRIKTRHAALLQLGYDVVSNKTVALQKLSSNRKGAADKDEERGNRDEDVDGKLKKGLADVGNGEDEWQEEEADEESNELLVRPHEDTESANVRFYPPFDGKPVPAVGTETRMRTDGREEGESEGGESEKSESGVGRGEVYGRGERTRRILRTKLGAVLRKSPYLIGARARSTNLDILVERAGVPVDKLPLQYFVGVVGKKAAGSVVRSYSSILILSVENMRGKVALLGDLIGRENAVLAVARVGVVHEAESATLRFEPSFDDEPVLPVGTEARLRAEGRDEGESEGGKSEKSGSRLTRAREVEDKVAGGGWTGERGGCKETEEEEKAVAMIAGVLREKFGPQIVTEEEYEGSTNERITDQEEAKGRQGEEEVGYGGGERGGVEAESEEDEEWKEGEDAEPEAELEAEAEESEEDAPPTTCPPKRPPPPYYGPRVVSLSSLLSLYRFFSSHLGISSPSTVASLLASHPALLRSDPTSDLLPRVHLLQSYGVSRPDISAITMRKSSWLRLSLSHLQEMLDFLLARGVRRTRLGSVLRKSRNLISVRARSTNLEFLVERGGVPVDKLGLIIDRAPDILSAREETIHSRLEQISAFFTTGSGEGNVNSGHLRKHLNGQHEDKNHLSRLLVHYPGILLRSSERIGSILRLLQSFSPPDSPSISLSILRRAPTLVHHSSQNLLAKLQGLEKLLGKKTVGIVVRSHPSVLNLSFENLQGKVALLGDLIGQGNAELAVARHPLILTSSEENFRRNFRELVREVEEALESGGEAGSGTQRLGEGALKHDAREYAEQGGSGAEIPAKTTSWAEASATARAGERRGFKSIAGATTACELVANLVVKFPNSICFSWERITSHKVEYLKRDMGLPITEVIKFPFFLGYSLDRRIRPRHVALLSKGYVFVPHEVALPVKGGERAEYKALEDGEDEGEKAEYGVGKHERGTAMDPTQDNSVALGKRGVSWQQERKAVCLGQLLLCSDHIFERRFDVELAPFLP